MKYGKGQIRKKANSELIYDGFFKEDKFEGDGILYLNNGYIYEGNFQRGKKQGRGTLYSLDKKFIYEGEWYEDEKEGFGREIFPDGTKFEGQFERGKKNGIGKNKKFKKFEQYGKNYLIQKNFENKFLYKI